MSSKNMNLSDLQHSLVMPTPPKITPPAEMMISEINFRYIMAKKEKKDDESIQISALIGGVQLHVQRAWSRENLVLIETYDDGVYSFTVAPSSAVALSLSIVKTTGEEPVKFMGFSRDS